MTGTACVFPVSSTQSAILRRKAYRQQFFAAYNLIDFLQSRQRKLLRHQIERNIGIFNLGTQALQRIMNNPGMIECDPLNVQQSDVSRPYTPST